MGILNIKYDLVTVQELFYLLSNYEGFCDADSGCVKILVHRKVM